MGTLAAQHTVSNASQSAAKQAIETYVAGLTGAVGDELKTALDQYDLIKFDVTSLDNGAVSDISNVTYTAEDKREAIAKYVRVIVPFFKHHEVIARQQGNNSTVTLMR
jgi:RNA-binding protein YhbY